jgi:hypothetical protein
MGSGTVVVILPLFCHLSYFLQTVKQIGIQQLLSKRSIVSFDKSILNGFSRLDKLQSDLFFLAPELKFIADKFRAIIHTDGFGFAPGF